LISGVLDRKLRPLSTSIYKFIGGRFSIPHVSVEGLRTSPTSQVREVLHELIMPVQHGPIMSFNLENNIKHDRRGMYDPTTLITLDVWQVHPQEWISFGGSIKTPSIA